MFIEYSMANNNNLNEIVTLITNAVENMQKNNIDQWDLLYPTREDFQADIINQQLYIGKINGMIAVVFALNQNSDEQYQNGKWTFPDKDYYVIHRLCVNPLYQNNGIGRKTMLHIENILRDRDIQAIRLDVFSENPYAIKLYEHMGYSRVGYADWRKGRFYLMEKYI